LLLVLLLVLFFALPPYRLSMRTIFASYLLVALFVIWATVFYLATGQEQTNALIGHIVKISIPAIFIAKHHDAARGLVLSMHYICIGAIMIYGLRQFLFVATGADIADAFNWVYPFMLSGVDRSILIHNFDIPSEFFRNSGPFREPGMYAANIIIAAIVLLSEWNHLNPKLRNHATASFLLALSTTQSTMGLLAAPFIGYVFLRRIALRGSTRILPYAALLGSLVVGLFFTFNGQSDKISAQLQQTSIQQANWYMSRFGNAVVDWAAIQQNPLLGLGFSEFGRPIYWAYGSALGFGNGLTGTVVKFGAIVALLLLCTLVLNLSRMFKSPPEQLAILFAVLAIVFSQQLLTLPLFYVLLIGFHSDWQARGRGASHRTTGSPLSAALE